MATAQRQIALGDLAHGAIAKYLKQVVAYEPLVLADTDPEPLHQMRVGLRRLRTAVHVFEVGLELPKAGREANIAAVGRRLGRLRDLDVIWAILRDRYAPHLPSPEQQRLGLGLLKLAKERHKTFKRVRKLLRGDRYTELKQSLTGWVKNPIYGAIAALPADQVVPDLVLPLVSQLWLHPGWWVGTTAHPGGLIVNLHLTQAETDALIADRGPTLHSLRKQVKRVRYQLRLVSDLYPGALEADIERLSAMQDTLGDLQDSTVLEDWIGEVVPNARGQMPTLFALLGDRRHAAWQQWQGYQQHYLEPAQRQRLRLALLKPGAQAQGLAPAESSNSDGPQPRRSPGVGKTANPNPKRQKAKSKTSKAT
ncbi:CHAD domain-containing protein [Leptolyngbya sp. KIOST-1]|uniref:CHAD domain-containing protein n=1 Tax=Leptolyngbya sp. KIOST-1 TaxID=1229172 RepID=UPI00068DBDB3|nr:CHAD domain-containing protein [Leptolyngbya sp. KIOST-1]